MGQGNSANANAGASSAWPFARCACRQDDEEIDEPVSDNEDDQEMFDDWDSRACKSASFVAEYMTPDERKDSDQSTSDSVSRMPTRAPVEDDKLTQLSSRSPLSSRFSKDPDQIVDDALEEAKAFIDEFLVLPAEATLALAIVALQERDATEAVQRLKSNKVYSSVLLRVQQYDLLCENLVPLPKFKLLWENENGYFYINQPAGSHHFEYKMVLNIDAPLGACVATANELELVKKAQPMLSAPPELLAPRKRHYLVTRTQLGVPGFKVELIFETVRVCNHEFGFMSEAIRTSFPTDGMRIPKKDWRTVRPCIDTSNLWLPRGGGQKGTVLVQVTRVDPGFRVPQVVLNFVFEKLADSFMTNLRKSSVRAAQRGSPWSKRIREDKLGLYAELNQIESVAAQRATISAKTLPGDEICARMPALS